MNQQVEYLRLHRHQVTLTAQLAKPGVQGVIIKAKFHVRHRFSRNNQVRLMKRSSVRQSLVGEFQSFCRTKVTIPLPLAESILCPTPESAAQPCRQVECYDSLHSCSALWPISHLSSRFCMRSDSYRISWCRNPSTAG